MNKLLPKFSHKEKPIRVGVLDTGIDLSSESAKHLCFKNSYYDFTGDGIEDKIGHGTFVSNLIVDNARDANFCLVIYKYYSGHATDQENMERSNLALQKAIKDKVDIINYSGGGTEFSLEERNLISNFPGAFITAAGNDGMELGIDDYNYYPAGYGLKNVLAVGALNKDGTKKLTSSNYGDIVRAWEIGDYGNWKGTSMATAVETGKVVYAIHRLGYGRDEHDHGHRR